MHPSLPITVTTPITHPSHVYSQPDLDRALQRQGQDRARHRRLVWDRVHDGIRVRRIRRLRQVLISVPSDLQPAHARRRLLSPPVYIAARKLPQLEAASAQLNQLGKSSGGSCVHIQADLKDKAGCDALAKIIKDKETKLDVLINNSGASWVSLAGRA